MPAELTAHVRPRVLCLARGTSSRLTIRDSAAGKNQAFCNYMPPPKMLARTGWPWARTQPAEPAYSPCPASLTQLPQPLTHPRSLQGGPRPGDSQCSPMAMLFCLVVRGPRLRKALVEALHPFPGKFRKGWWASGLCQPSSKHELGWAPRVPGHQQGDCGDGSGLFENRDPRRPRALRGWILAYQGPEG